MSILHHLAQAAAVILLVELLVVLLIFLGVAGGLAFGLHWVRGKSDWLFEKANEYLALLPKYTHVGTGLVAKPFILGGGGVARLTATLEAIRRQVRRNRATSEQHERKYSVPRVLDPDATAVVPTVSEATTSVPLVPEASRRA